MAAAAHAWSDPILVTPDSAGSIHSRVVFDPEGNLHFFFANNRYQEIGAIEQYDIYHCKYRVDGTRLTEDVRLDTTQSFFWVYPSPIYGSDDRLHVAWADNLHFLWNEYNGIYYARLDQNGNVEREATRIFEEESALDAHLFQDSQGDLNVVWVHPYDTLYYGKFDTSAQVLIPETPVYAPGGGIAIWYMNACMDNLDQIHCIYKNYYGTWDEYNLGYSRVNNQGDVLVEYAALTPESPESCCPTGYIVADMEDNFHILYHMLEGYSGYQHYRKIDQNLNTIYDVIVEDIAFLGENSGDGDIVIDGRGLVAMVWPLHDMGIPFQYRFVRYTTEGIPLSEPETILQEDGNWPDLAVGPHHFYVFNWTGAVEYLPGSKILYSYKSDPPPAVAINPQPLMTDIEISAFPNPFNNKLTFQLQWPRGGDIQVEIIDAAGRRIDDYGGFFLQGTRNFMLDKRLSSGVYYLVVTYDLNRTIQPIIHLK